MRRRDVLKNVGAASTVMIGATTAASASRPETRSIAESDRLIVAGRDGEPVMLDIEDVEQFSEIDDHRVEGYSADDVTTSCDCCRSCSGDCFLEDGPCDCRICEAA